MENFKNYNYLKLIVFTFVFFITVYYTVLPRSRFSDNDLFLNSENVFLYIIGSGSSNNNSTLNNKPAVVILLWTKYFGNDPLKGLGLTSTRCDSVKDSFDVLTCQFTTDRKFLDSADAVLFHFRDTNRFDFPKQHKSDQMWIFLHQESPVNTFHSLKDYSNIFNWTMTYRLDSDVYFPYGKAILKNTNKTKTVKTYSESSDLKAVFRNKTKLAVWFVSNCQTQSEREKFVKELQNFVSVDIYGKCGSDKCPRNSENDCLENIYKSYKFYLSFENSLCVDYVTEKFFNPLRSEFPIIPIVYGGANYSEIAPPHSFINVNDFASIKELANYLLHLDKNETEYLKYFEWKSKYRIIPHTQGWCTLCSKLVQKTISSYNNTYQDLKQWWYNEPKVGRKTNCFNKTCSNDTFQEPVCFKPQHMA